MNTYFGKFTPYKVRNRPFQSSAGHKPAPARAMSQNDIIKEALSHPSHRRGLLKKLAAASAAVGATVVTGNNPLEAQSSGPAPSDVVQFALNLEYLEAEFYSVATSGMTLQQRGIAITGSGTAGATTTRYGMIAFQDQYNPSYASALGIAADEIAHVQILRTALTNNGVTPIAKPAINLDALASLGPSLANQASFLQMARIFEDIGVSAYGGGAVYLSGSPYLTTAARILAVEGEHVSNIRLQIARLGIPTLPSLDPADILPPPSGSNLFSTNSANGLSAIRTPGQVLYLAYGMAANATSGGFFPNGVNGVLNTSSSPATAANLALA